MTTVHSFLGDEIDRVLGLCTNIAQLAARIRLKHLRNVSYTPETIQSSYEVLLTMAEDIEGSAVLLESLLAVQQRCLPSRRIHYTREKLLQLRGNVPVKLSDDVGDLLREVVERESNEAINQERKSWRDIRTILK